MNANTSNIYNIINPNVHFFSDRTTLYSYLNSHLLGSTNLYPCIYRHITDPIYSPQRLFFLNQFISRYVLTPKWCKPNLPGFNLLQTLAQILLDNLFYTKLFCKFNFQPAFEASILNHPFIIGTTNYAGHTLTTLLSITQTYNLPHILIISTNLTHDTKNPPKQNTPLWHFNLIPISFKPQYSAQNLPSKLNNSIVNNSLFARTHKLDIALSQAFLNLCPNLSPNTPNISTLPAGYQPHNSKPFIPSNLSILSITKHSSSSLIFLTKSIKACLPKLNRIITSYISKTYESPYNKLNNRPNLPNLAHLAQPNYILTNTLLLLKFFYYGHNNLINFYQDNAFSTSSKPSNSIPINLFYASPNNIYTHYSSSPNPNHLNKKRALIANLIKSNTPANSYITSIIFHFNQFKPLFPPNFKPQLSFQSAFNALNAKPPKPNQFKDKLF